MTDIQSIKDKFILHWGEMGSLWGINRTMAQIHALLFISPEALSAVDIMQELKTSRGNVSMALRELIAWGIVSRVHKKGERREYYTTEKDVWVLFRTIARERKKRELDPTVEVLRDSLEHLKELPNDEAAYERKQIQELLAFFEMGIRVYEDLEAKTPDSVLKLLGQTLRLTNKISSR